MKKLCVVIINYRRGEMTCECLEALRSGIEGHDDRHAVVIDNASDDNSADTIEAAIDKRHWGNWVTLVRSEVNGGFAAGNNVGFRTCKAETYLLLNSDTLMQPGAVDQMLQTLDEHPDAGMLGPRLEDPDGTAQISCFRYRTPFTEFLEAAGTRQLDAMFRDALVAMPLTDELCHPQWVSFACILIRRELIEQIGPMDEGYFMYFEDIAYARHATAAGWTVLYDPSAHVVHLRGGTSSVKASIAARQRVPRYYYESRTRYFAHFHGGLPGLWWTNLLWLTGRTIALTRELLGSKLPHARASQARDNWTNWMHPRREPTLPQGGEL